jgi:FecR protein
MGALIALATSAHAQQDIGATAAAHKEVSRELSGASAQLNTGDPVFRDEVVRTGTESTAKLVFLDSTNLAVGPISRVVLDRFIYDPKSAESLGVKLAKGVFRFTTGALHKDAYSITTPTAGIGVRGTVLDISVQGHRTRVTVVEGRALVCPIKRGITFAQQARNCEKPHPTHCDCADVGAGQTAQASSAGGAVQVSLIPVPVQFASFCSGDASLCSSQNYASLNPNTTPPPPPGNPPPQPPSPPGTPGNPPPITPAEVAPATSPPTLAVAALGAVAAGGAVGFAASTAQSPSPGPAPAPELGASLFGMLLAGGVATYIRARRRRK